LAHLGRLNLITEEVEVFGTKKQIPEFRKNKKVTDELLFYFIMDHIILLAFWLTKFENSIILTLFS
jgi:hypothetical protein